MIISPFNNEFGSCTDSYDDKCILGLALRFNAVVVSNDNYRDLINTNADWRQIIENRVIPFCYFKDIFLLPRDPYGAGRPSLDSLLNVNL